MRPKVKTTPDLSFISEAHQQALRNGNDHFRLWERNVADRFKDMPDPDVKAQLQATAHPFAVCFEHWIGDFNMGSGIRNANAFNAKEVFYLGERKWDRRSAVGVYNYTPVQWLTTTEDLIKLQEKYVLVGVDNVPGAISLRHYSWHPNTLMIFGEEGVGLTPGVQALCRDLVEIEMYGSVRSLNCGVASGIMMHDFVSKYNKDQQ
jgi:tRNA G18 (ribose-2'-O)-methylase SpoU